MPTTNHRLKTTTDQPNKPSLGNTKSILSNIVPDFQKHAKIRKSERKSKIPKKYNIYNLNLPKALINN